MASLISPSLKVARTAPPAFGIISVFGGVQERVDPMLANLAYFLATSLVSVSKFLRLTAGTIIYPNMIKYNWQFYRAQANKIAILEGGPFPIAFGGFKLGGIPHKIFSSFNIDGTVNGLEVMGNLKLFDETPGLPQIVPLQIGIIGNVAIVSHCGEPAYMYGVRVEKTVLNQLAESRGIKKVIMNGHANENCGYIFTPEEYEAAQRTQFPRTPGFQLYGKWTGPAMRYNFEKLAFAMQVGEEHRENMLDRTIVPATHSASWYERANNVPILEHLRQWPSKQ